MFPSCVTGHGRVLRLLTCAGVACALSFPMAAGAPRRTETVGRALALQASPGQLIIAEFRLSGPDGDDDEFVEILNVGGIEHTVATADESAGYALATSAGVVVVIPNGTVIPNNGYYLVTNATGYSLSSYPAGTTTATADITYTADIPDNTGLALFNTADTSNFTLANRLDAVGSEDERNDLYMEGPGYPVIAPGSIQYSLVRRHPGGCTGSEAAPSGNCNTVAAIQGTNGPFSGRPQDTGSNAADFIFVDTAAADVGFGRRLGAPGPSNLDAPIGASSALLGPEKLDACAGRNLAPNRVRGTNTLEFRHTFTNFTGASMSRLRFRIVDITTQPAIAGVADLRAQTSTDTAVTVDRPPCGSGTSGITVRGTTLEEPPAQAAGGGYNSSLSVGHVSAAQPLANGGTVDVRFVLGIAQEGYLRFCVVAEGSFGAGGVTCFLGHTVFLTKGKGDFDGNGTTDLAIYRPSTSTWYVRNQFSVQYGQPGDVPVPGYYGRDGKTDVAFYRPSTGNWDVRNLGIFVVDDTSAGDIPVPADYDDDGVVDFAIYRPSDGSWIGGGLPPVVTLGGPGYVPVPGDYIGDGAADRALFQPSTGKWFIPGQATVQFGDPGDRAVPDDYNGDGKMDIAVYRPSTGQWFVRNQFTAQFGDPSDWPIPGDYDGNGTADVAVYRRSTGQWFVRNQFTVQFGDPGDVPMPPGVSNGLAVGGDFNGDAATDIALYRASTGHWFVRNQLAVQFGDPSDRPVPADYNGDRRMDIAVYRPSTGHWFVRNQPTVQFGDPSDKPVPGDYNGDALMDVAVYRPSTGAWFVRNQFSVTFGGDANDIPIPGDYNGDGRTDPAVYRTSTRTWYVRNIMALQFGDPGDIAIPGDYNGDGTMDVAVYRPSTGQWFVRNILTVQFGDPGDKPVPGDYNGDGKTDVAIYRPSSGHWFVRNQFSVQFGDSAHAPVVRIGGPQ